MVPDRYRFLVSLTSGNTPFPGPLESFRRRFEPQKRAAFVLELSPGGVVAKRFSIPAQIATVASLILGMLGGLAVIVGFTAPVSAGTSEIQFGKVGGFIASLAVIMLIPLGTAGGMLIGRRLLRDWPQPSGVELRVVSVDLGTLFSSVELASARGTIRVRVITRRKRLGEALRLAHQMPSDEHVFRTGPFA